MKNTLILSAIGGVPIGLIASTFDSPSIGVLFAALASGCWGTAAAYFGLKEKRNEQ